MLGGARALMKYFFMIIDKYHLSRIFLNSGLSVDDKYHSSKIYFNIGVNALFL